jgi:hypothetical protein
MVHIILVMSLFRFKKLTVDERINALSTVHPTMTETLINMHRKNDSGNAMFSLT